MAFFKKVSDPAMQNGGGVYTRKIDGGRARSRLSGVKGLHNTLIRLVALAAAGTILAANINQFPERGPCPCNT
jgi:hypothetical protein